MSSLSQSRCVILKLLLSSNYDCFLSFLLLFCVVLPLIPHKQAQNLCFQPFSSTLTSNDNSFIFSVFSLFILLFILALFDISHFLQLSPSLVIQSNLWTHKRCKSECCNSLLVLYSVRSVLQLPLKVK